MGCRFTVKSNKIRTAGNEMQRICGELRTSVSDITSLKGSLSFQLAARGRIEKRLSAEITNLNNEIISVVQMQKQLESILRIYTATENRLLGRDSRGSSGRGREGADQWMQDLIDWLQERSGQFPSSLIRILQKLADLLRLHPDRGPMDLLVFLAAGGLAFADFGSNGTDGSWQDADDGDVWKEGPWSITKSLMKIAGKFEKEVREHKGAGSVLGFTGKGMSYVESLIGFMTGDKKGAAGASDLCDLADSSCELWNGFYKIVENKYKNLFEVTDKTGKHKTPYGTKWSRVSNTVSIAGNIIGWGGDIADLFDDKKNPTATDKISSGIKSTTHGVDIVTTVYDIKNKTDGFYTPSMIYGTIADSGIETVSVAYKDIANLRKDGWSVDDTAQTMLDSSTAGLYKMIDKMTFGLVSEDTTGLSAQEISDGLREGAKGWGQEAGNRIVNDPWKRKVYENGNGFVKSCVITQSIVETGADYAKEGAKTVARKAGEVADQAWNAAKDKARDVGEAIDSAMPWNWW